MTSSPDNNWPRTILDTVAAQDRLPDHMTILQQTDWASLKQPFPEDIVVADELANLLDGDPAVRVKALGALSEAANHQNTIYPVTASVARYAAALLADQRTEAMAPYKRNMPPVSLRVALLDWLGSMADDASDGSVASAARSGFGVSAATAEFRAARPRLFDAVSEFADDRDIATRHAAVTASLLLLDSAEERHRHRDRFAPLVAEILASSPAGYYRDRAADSLAAWGEPAVARRRRDNPWFPSSTDADEPTSNDPWSTDPWSSGVDKPPPF